MLSSSFLRNVPRPGQGPLSREYSRTVGHRTLQDEPTHPWNGSSYDVSRLHVTVSTCLHTGMEQTQSTSFKQTPVGGSHRPALHRQYPAVQPAKLRKDRAPPNAAPSSPSGPFPRIHFSRPSPGCNLSLIFRHNREASRTTKIQLDRRTQVGSTKARPTAHREKKSACRT